MVAIVAVRLTDDLARTVGFTHQVSAREGQNDVDAHGRSREHLAHLEQQRIEALTRERGHLDRRLAAPA